MIKVLTCMKNLQKNQSAIGPQSYRLAEKVNGKDTYIYPQILITLSGYTCGIYFYNGDQPYNAALSVPNLPGLNDNMYFYIKPNSEDNDKWYFYSVYYFTSREYWAESDTGSRVLKFLSDTEYTIFGSSTQITQEEQFDDMAIPVARFETTTDKYSPLVFKYIYPEWVFQHKNTCNVNQVSDIRVGTSDISILLDSDNPFT